VQYKSSVLLSNIAYYDNNNNNNNNNNNTLLHKNTKHVHVLGLESPMHDTNTSHPRPTQPSIPPGSLNEYQLRLGRQRQVWFIPLADERGVCR